ncbi:hypothetical protein nbrc107696_02170 [Gordonia spumicola]|uniref:DUF4333 domain-containing protein n=1 Tax=Gordonia spumicola TaxID=589161 RepID=A0A7I9V441_9ACTN|nr:DUF4333 domain-containing protein [Gordonia spumicola]GED99770.1 hypothetical protein nbrc107696_02170 [Gordonia spumicola]
MRVLALSAFVVTPLLASCSFSVGGTTIDQDKLKNEITTTLNTEYATVGSKVDSITCDDPGKDPAVGTKFQCTAKASGTDVRIDVTVTSDSGDIKYQTVDFLFSMSDLTTKLTRALDEQVPGASVDCGSGFKAQPANTQIDCPATSADGETGSVTYFVTDKPETNHWKLN